MVLTGWWLLLCLLSPKLEMRWIDRPIIGLVLTDDLLLGCCGPTALYRGHHQALPAVHGQEADQAAGDGEELDGQEEGEPGAVEGEHHGNQTD